jgi:hypothetical protein
MRCSCLAVAEERSLARRVCCAILSLRGRPEEDAMREQAEQARRFLSLHHAEKPLLGSLRAAGDG